MKPAAPRIRRTFSFEVTPQEDGVTVSDILRTRHVSHAILVSLKSSGGVKKNGESVFLNQRVSPGDRIGFTLPAPEEDSSIVPVEVPFTIFYEDEDLLVVNKEAGLPVHPSINHYTDTLANGVCYYYRENGEPFRFHCINRLDRDTSGLLIIAKNAYSAAVLSEQMRNREIHRTYLALTEGWTPDEGTIDAKIGRIEGSVIERGIDPVNGETAVTHFKTRERKNGLSLLELHLETGRTHQIRVHLKSIGHPIIGDFLYNPDFSKIDRQALHSASLVFTHPVTGEEMTLKTGLPEDMETAFSL